MSRLSVRGARQHNLKGFSVDIPRDKLVVITGPSGSGKSSLAFDTIYAEGQRRYVESLSAYARQFLEQLDKPKVDSIEGLSPAIAIEQRALTRSQRSTVGTVTEVADYLRLLFARVGTPHCPNCGKVIRAQTAQQIVDRILALPEGTKVSLLAPIAQRRRGELKLELDRLRREGFVRVRVDGETIDLGDEIVLDGKKTHDLDVVIDRIIVKEGIKTRVADSTELSLRWGEGRVLVNTGDEELVMSERFACVDCGISLPPIEPRMFSFNGPHGACPTCGGLGTRTRVDADRILGSPDKSLREGVVLAWGRRGTVTLMSEVERAVRLLGVDPDLPWKKLSPSHKEDILRAGAPAEDASPTPNAKKKKPSTYVGIIPRLEEKLHGERDVVPRLEDESDDEDLDEPLDLGRFVVTKKCDACNGKRLRKEALAVRLAGKTIADACEMPLDRLKTLLVDLESKLAEGSERTSELGPLTMDPKRMRPIAEPLIRAIVSRLGFLINVGLDYLTLDRSAATLSGGEGQRIRLATQIGAALVGVLYVLDEPSVGLHARDNARLLEAVRTLVRVGNSVIVVEHDREAIESADHVIDMGPGAGELGGRIVAEGTAREIIANPNSVTGPYLSGAKRLVDSAFLAKRRRPTKARIVIENAREHNLRGVDVSIPVGLMTAVTGVSGSGKSSLVSDTLLPAARAHLYGSSGNIGECDRVTGLEHIDKVVSIDQNPIGRTPRSNPATYTGIFGLLRELFATLPDARARGYKAGRFSFNVKGGRCETCQGDGVLRVEMHFLPDVFVECEACEGRRYNRETLEVKYRGLSVADMLDLTVKEAFPVLESVPRIAERLAALDRVGLGYLRLGQPATTLSGGEAQRVKLARELARRATGKTLYVFDEPTTGLHFSDIEMLLVALRALVNDGNTVVIIEHNLELVANCDHVIDLGPEGGERGGELVAFGSPEEVATAPRSHTARYLREVLSAANLPEVLSQKGRAALEDEANGTMKSNGKPQKRAEKPKAGPGPSKSGKKPSPKG